MAGLLVYKASAGSGKTYRLVAEYIKMLIEKPDVYRRILAVTFTNKATAEMKGRIIDKLYKLKKNAEPEMMQTLKAETGKDEATISKQAGIALSYILHDYSMFSISTIDSFVQRIIQNLLWELGQHGNNELILDYNPYIEKATDALLDELTNHPELFDHVKRMIEERLDENKSANIQNELIELGKLLFHEQYKLLSSDERELMHNKEALEKLKAEVNRIIDEINETTKKLSANILEHICKSDINGINSDNYRDFFKKRGGIIPMIVNLSDLKRFTPIELKDVAEQAVSDISVWLNKDKINLLSNFVEQRLIPEYTILYNYLEENYRLYNTAIAINENLSTLYILNELYQKLREKLNDDGVMLLSDSSALLKEFVSQTDTPFIYEKIGTTYNSYMLDEFQDTSQLQWRNFEPLIADSIGSQGLSMVVGDVKQSIYRWRNSDWRIMAGIENDNRFYPQVKQLTLNYRSARTVVEFNNHFFKNTIEIVNSQNDAQNSSFNLKDLYSDVEQKVLKSEPKGYVEVAFVPPRTDEANDTFTNHIKDLLIDLKKRGYRAGDIAFLVRKNDQGRELAELLLKLNKSESELSGFIKIVSQDALILNSSAAVRLCVAALKIALNPNDTLAVAQFRKELASLKDKDEEWTSVFLPQNPIPMEWLNSIRFYPLGYMVEAIIEKYLYGFNIDIKDHLPYLSLLHEFAIDFSYRGTSSLSRFIEWYERDGKSKKLEMAETENAINILTIHKSKGLEFPVIIFPYADLLNQHKKPDGVMWYKLPLHTPNKTLNSYPLFPIKPKKSLEQTYFEVDYLEEQFCKKIDDINLQYVAFTRARNELYLLVTNKDLSTNEMDKTQENINKNPFVAYLPKSDNLKPKTEIYEQKMVYIYGEKENNIATENVTNGKTKTVEHYSINPMKGKIAQQFKTDTANADPASDLQHGIAMHAILSRIITLNNLPEAIDWAIQNGYISADQRQNTHDNLKSILNKEPYKQWFSEMWEVKNEASIINTDGNIYRPDRVLVGENQAIVIDFKFGVPTPKHRKQVEQYKKLLLDMGYTDVKAYLWYFQLNRHEEV